MTWISECSISELTRRTHPFVPHSASFSGRPWTTSCSSSCWCARPSMRSSAYAVQEQCHGREHCLAGVTLPQGSLGARALSGRRRRGQIAFTKPGAAQPVTKKQFCGQSACARVHPPRAAQLPWPKCPGQSASALSGSTPCLGARLGLDRLFRVHLLGAAPHGAWALCRGLGA